MGLLESIKKAGIGAYEASNPVNILYGTVTNTNPLSVNVDQRFPLTQDFLIVPESLTRYTVDLEHNHACPDGLTSNSLSTVVIREGLKTGDEVILIRKQGGEQYVILDKVAKL